MCRNAGTRVNNFTENKNKTMLFIYIYIYIYIYMTLRSLTKEKLAAFRSTNFGFQLASKIYSILHGAESLRI